MARCQLCNAKHPGELAACPEIRTGELVLDKYVVGALLVMRQALEAGAPSAARPGFLRRLLSR